MEILTYILIAVPVIVVILTWAPWSRGSLFNKNVNIRFYNWESSWGGAGKKIDLNFKTSGKYGVKVFAKNTEKKTVLVNEKSYRVGTPRSVETIDLDGYPSKVIIEINDGSAKESCVVYSL